MPDDAKKPHDPLDITIEKLESFIGNKEEDVYQVNIPVLQEVADPHQASANVPILDELVTKEEISLKKETVEHATYTEEKLKQLIDSLEDKLGGELKSLMDSLQGSMKDTITEEVRTQIDLYSSKQEQAPEEDEETRDPNQHHDGYRPYGLD